MMAEMNGPFNVIISRVINNNVLNRYNLKLFVIGNCLKKF